MPDLKMNPAGGKVTSVIRILKAHVGVTAIDLWDDTDHNGRPDLFLKRVKNYNDRENEPVELAQPDDLDGKIVQWIWMPSQPPQSIEGWEVEIDVTQGGISLANMPLRLAGDYPDGQRFGIFQTWYRLVKA
jgi:hypothetical protein